MIQKGAAALAVLALVALSSPTGGQTNRPVGTPPSSSLSAPAAPASGVPQATSGSNPENPVERPDCPGGNCDLPAPRISIATPAPAPTPWTWQERISWAANLVLVVLAYIGIMLVVSLLRKIERQGQLVEDAAQAAAESARVALKLAEAKERAERPWLLMSVRPAVGVENTFSVIATNRGRGPARILLMVDEIVCAIDEKHLAATPAFLKEPTPPQEPIILLPDETIELVSFSRDDAKQVCETDELMKRVEDWEEKIFLYGKVTYRDLTAPDEAPVLESSWLCWYIHGRQKSGMVMAGSPAYNLHM